MRLQSRHTLLEKVAQLHWGVLTLLILLMAAGSTMLYSASGADMHPWADAHILRFIPAFMIALGIALMPITVLARLSYPAYALGIALLLWVEASGHIGMGAQRWINLGFMTLQPSELMKLAVIMALARYFHGLHPDNMRSLMALLPAAGMIGAPAVLILMQPNLGTTIILLFISGVMLFMAGVYLRVFVLLGSMALAAIPLGWFFLLHDYQKKRVLTFLDPSQDPLGAGYNITQSTIAIGSGGLAGKGLTQGSQGQLNFLPEKQTDFIFTMLAEELGFLGGAILLATYGLLLLLSMRVALQSRHTYGALMSIGVTAMLFIHILINVGMVMGMFPVVGVPLPFLSYGGSFLIATVFAVGLLLHCHRHRDVSLERSFRMF